MDYRANQTGAVTTARIDYSNSNTDHLLFISSDLHIDGGRKGLRAETARRGVRAHDGNG